MKYTEIEQLVTEYTGALRAEYALKLEAQREQENVERVKAQVLDAAAALIDGSNKDTREQQRADQIPHPRRQERERGVADGRGDQHAGVADAADRQEDELPAEGTHPVGEDCHQRCHDQHREIGAGK